MSNIILGLVGVMLANPLAFAALAAVIVGVVVLLERSDRS